MIRFLAILIVGVLSTSAAGAAPPAGSRPQVTVWSDLPDLAPSVEPEPWLPGPPALPSELPNFEAEVPETRDAALPDAARWQEATVIVVIPGGFGSGAIVSSDGWILTNYHVVEGPLQAAAISGDLPVKVEILTCEATSHGPRRRPGSLQATVYRADPTHDLALLKLEGKAPATPWPHFDFHQGNVDIQSQCYAVGSQGGGLPWAVRRGFVTVVGEFPYGFTEFVTGSVDSSQAAGLRQRLDLIITSCEISSGDSGGPLVDAAGKLMGLTFATPTNLSTGAVGFHVSVSEIAKFMKSLPRTPEGSPFDLWMAGVPEVAHGRPNIGLFRKESHEYQALQLPMLLIRGDHMLPVANTLFLDFANRNNLVPGRDPRPELAVPTGLWGMRNPGGFVFDVLVVCRADSVVAVGYAGASREVEEIRIDTDHDGRADCRWQRDIKGWSLQKDKGGLPLTDVARLGAERAEIIQSVLDGCSGRK